VEEAMEEMKDEATGDDDVLGDVLKVLRKCGLKITPAQ
jgi:hypothetical protein